MSSKNVDRLSQMPEDILSHIFSLMPTKFVVRTSVLSKRWRYNWTLVTNLDFDLHHRYSLAFEKYVDRVLDSCEASQINLFRLTSSYYSGFAQKSKVLNNWNDKAVKLNVHEVHINFILYEFPLSFFACKTLTILRMSNGYWECPCPVNLPSLRILDIARFKGSFVSVFMLISGSPLLECLSLELSPNNNDGNNYIFNIPTLKRLKLVFHKFDPVMRRVILSVPNLEYLHVSGKLCSSFVMEDVSSLVEASISFDFVVDGPHLLVELLQGVCGVKSLSLAFLKKRSISPLPIFPNLKRSELKGLYPCGQMLSFFEKCPELEHLYIKQAGIYGWIGTEVVPDSIRTKLTTLKFSSHKWQKRDVKFLEYMLGNADVFQTVTITLHKSTSEKEEEGRLWARLMKLKRASKCCEIRFHGTVSRSTGS